MSFPPAYRAKSRGDVSGEESRAKAVAVATELFATSGYKGTSVAQVAAKTGLSQSGLLHHFPSKAALLAAVLEERDRQDGDFLYGSSEPPLGWAAFDALTALVARNSTRPQLVGLFVRLAAEAIEPSHPAHTWIREHYEGTRNWLTDAVQGRGRTRRVRGRRPGHDDRAHHGRRDGWVAAAMVAAARGDVDGRRVRRFCGDSARPLEYRRRRVKSRDSGGAELPRQAGPRRVATGPRRGPASAESRSRQPSSAQRCRCGATSCSGHEPGAMGRRDGVGRGRWRRQRCA